MNEMKICTTLGYVVSQILFNKFPSSRGFVKQYNQELCMSSIARCFTKRPLKRMKWIPKMVTPTESNSLEITQMNLETTAVLNKHVQEVSNLCVIILTVILGKP